MIAAGKASHIATAHWIADVAAQQHRRDQTDLIDVVALLPATHSAPRDLRRSIERIECVGGDAAMTHLMCRDAEVAQLELLVLADEDVERREVAMESLAPMQCVERAQDGGDLASDEALRLCAFFAQPYTKVAVDGVLDHHAVAGATVDDLHEPVVHFQRALLAIEQVGEIRFAQPGGQALGDFDANLRRQSMLRSRYGEVDLTEATFANQSVQDIAAAALGAVGGTHSRCARRAV